MLESVINNPLAAALISNVAVMSLALYVAKRILEKYLDTLFQRSQLRYETALKISESRSSDLFRSQIPIYAEIHEAIYRARNAARDCTYSHSPPFDAVQDFGAARSHIVENLYKYRLFVDEQNFKQLHKYKWLVQEIGILLDSVSRSTELDDVPVDMNIRKLGKAQMESKYLLLDELFYDLDKGLREELTVKTDQMREHRLG